MDDFIAFITEQLKASGIRPSYQRIKVLEYMHRKGGHPTADEIFRALSDSIPSLSKVTIYNTLHTFVESGMLRIVVIDETETHYDLTLGDHGHFQCNRCGEIYNFNVNIAPAPYEGLSEFEITHKDVYFRGLCPHCCKQTKTKKKE